MQLLIACYFLGVLNPVNWIDFVSLKQLILNQQPLCPPGDISGDIYGCFIPWMVSGQRPWVLLNILQCTGQPSTTKNYPAQDVSGAEVRKLCSRVGTLWEDAMYSFGPQTAKQSAGPRSILAGWLANWSPLHSKTFSHAVTQQKWVCQEPPLSSGDANMDESA